MKGESPVAWKSSWKSHRMYDVALACRLSRYRESINIKWDVTKKGRINVIK